MALTCKPFGDIITFTRASTATYFNSAGTLTSAAINEPRLDYDPATLAARGFLIEEARTNGIRNNTMQGAVAGTPGTGPTNWVVPGTVNGLTQTISVGTENGIAYVDFRYAGTTTASSSHQISFEAANQIAAASGQTWTRSAWFKTQAGSTANLTVNHNLQGRDAGNTTFTETFVTDITASLTGTLTRLSTASTLANASTAFVRSAVTFVYNNGVAIDITLRIGLPQLEQGAFATSVIPTTTTALTRSADVASVNTLSPWYNATEGTLFAQANVISSSYTQGVLVDLGAGGAFGTTEYVNWSGTGWILNPNTPPINVSSSIATTSTAKVAAGLKTNDSVISANGLLGAVDTSCGVVVAPTTLSIGKAGWAAGNYFNGWIQRITYYPRRLSNAELVSITTP